MKLDGCLVLIVFIAIIFGCIMTAHEAGQNEECERKSTFGIGQQVKVKGLDSSFIVRYKQCQRGIEYLTILGESGETEVLEASFIER